MTRTSPTYIHGRIIIYLYFPLGRLVRENDEDRSVTICYNYDSNGNILSKVEYPYTTGALTSATRTVPYTYAVSWGDQLLTYNNGSTILYDQIGNPLSYNGYTFTWQKGRQLASANDGTNSYQFIYNADGQRTWKTKNNSSTQYTYASGLLVSMTDGTNTLNFTYDPDGIALGVNLNSTDYYYLYNAQGDVIALYDSAGTVVTEYKYDSWGKLLSTTGSAAATIGLLNPLRYRGYFYDTDLGFYLLETRYYDPETGRFINADGVLDARSANGANLYEYCLNNPINAEDTNGKKPKWLAAAVSNAVVSALSQGIKTYKANRSQKGAFKTALKAAAKAGAGGFITGMITGKISGIAVKRVSGNANPKRSYARQSAILQGIYAFGKSYYKHAKPALKNYPARVNAALTYVPKESRSKGSYDRFKECTASVLPTKADYVSGILSAASAFGTGKLMANLEGLGDWQTACENTEIDKWNLELASALTQEMISEVVKMLFEGE